MSERVAAVVVAHDRVASLETLLLSTGSGAERLRVATMLAAKIVSLPVGATVEGLARREWKRDRGRPNDSAQYLLFEKR